MCWKLSSDLFCCTFQSCRLMLYMHSKSANTPCNSKATALLQLCSTNSVSIARQGGESTDPLRLLMRSVWLWHCMTSTGARIHHNKPMMDIHNRIDVFGLLSMALVAGTSSPYFDDCLQVPWSKPTLSHMVTNNGDSVKLFLQFLLTRCIPSPVDGYRIPYQLPYFAWSNGSSPRVRGVPRWDSSHSKHHAS